jgi:hypothetical protein
VGSVPKCGIAYRGACWRASSNPRRATSPRCADDRSAGDRLRALSRGRGLDSRRVLVEACEVLARFSWRPRGTATARRREAPPRGHSTDRGSADRRGPQHAVQLRPATDLRRTRSASEPGVTPGAEPSRGGLRCEPALELRHPWAGPCSDKRCAGPRPEPDSGNPTVRGRRGASGNVASRSSVSVRARVRLLSRQPHGRIEAAAGGNRHQSAMPPVPAPPADPTALLLSVEPFGGGGW